MRGTDGAGSTRRVRLQAMAIGAIVAVDGIVASLLGAPVWLAPLYVVLGLALAWARIALARARRPAAPEPAPQEPPAVASATPAPAAPAPERRAIGYACVPTASNGDLRAHTDAVTAFCAERGLALETVVHDVESPGTETRPTLAWALEQIAKQQAEVLVVPRLRDLSSNVANLAPLLRWFESDQRTLMALDVQLDTSTEAGRLAAGAIVGVGGWEHDRISERTRAGLEAARSRGGAQGRTAVADIPELQERIARMRDEGMTLQAIADVLNEEGVPTLRGGAMWRPSSVQRATGYRRPSAATRGIELPKFKPPEI
jgi:DNA invertase Pin-like site-specific DNA recombinase